MKKNSLSGIGLKLILMFFLISILISIFFKPVSAKDFQIIITDLNEKDITEITEKEYFRVYIIDPLTEEATPYVHNVNIIFNENPYFLDETGVLELKAPEVYQDKYCAIKASKNGYNTTNSTILVRNNVTKKLKILTSDIVDGGDLFSVQVTDDDQPPSPISGALVFIQSDEATNDELYTNNEGYIILRAPKDRESIRVIAAKDGYIQNYKTIVINIEPIWWETLIKNNYFPIIISLIILIMIIIFVHFQQQKSLYKKAKEITDRKALERYETPVINRMNTDKTRPDAYYNRSNIRIQKQDNTKIEEIRISRSSRDKEIITIDADKKIQHKNIKKKKNQNDENELHKGSYDVRYEIDKLTGEIDEEGIDKWFEGIEDLRKRVDEKMKKKVKRNR
jgi:hypothetical protein